MAEPSFDREQAHRWFAIECNNRAWDLVEMPNRMENEDESMIHAAHAALWHWSHAGSKIHRLRGLCLLATAYVAAGDGASGVRVADQCLSLLKELGDEPTEFDCASSYGCAAIAYRLDGRDSADAYRRQADELAGKLRNDQERAVFDAHYGSGKSGSIQGRGA